MFKWILDNRFQGGTTDLWRANLDPVRLHSVEVLAMYSYYMGVTRKRSWEVSNGGGGERTFREMDRWRTRESVQFLKCHIYKILSGLFIVVPVLRRTVPESSYTVTCLPLQTVTESCWYETHPVTMISISVFTSLHGNPLQRCSESFLTYRKISIILPLLISSLTLVTHTPLMCMSDCRARCTPVVNWVMLSWVGVSCTAATCWLKWADITCSHRISTVFELLAASRFRLEPHWNGRSEWTFPADCYTYVDKNVIFMFICHHLT